MQQSQYSLDDDNVSRFSNATQKRNYLVSLYDRGQVIYQNTARMDNTYTPVFTMNTILKIRDTLA